MRDPIVYYDATFSVGNHRGMGKYIKNLKSVIENKLKIICIGVLPNGYSYNSDEYISFGFSFYFLWEQISLYLFTKKTKGIFIFPYNTAPLLLKKSKNNVLIIHDLIFMNNYESKSLRQKVGNAYRRIILPRIIKKYNNIITVSNYSKNKIIEHFNIKEENISVIPNSVELKDFNPNSNFPVYQKEEYFFHIGGEPSYKNSMKVIEAYSLLPIDYITKFKLFIVGIRDPKVLKIYSDYVKLKGLSDCVIFLPYQSNNEIELLYKKAALFIFPSIEEGFGIPIIESFKFGCPLLCSNSSCLPEIAQNAALYFDPYSVKELTNGILNILNDAEATSYRINIGYQLLNYYSKDLFDKKIEEWFKSRYTD